MKIKKYGYIIVFMIMFCFLCVSCKKIIRNSEVYTTKVNSYNNETDSSMISETTTINQNENYEQTTTENQKITLTTEELITKDSAEVTKKKETTTVKKKETTSKKQNISEEYTTYNHGQNNNISSEENVYTYHYAEEDIIFVKNILSKIIKSDMSDFEKVKAIYDYLLMEINSKEINMIFPGIPIYDVGIRVLKEKKADDGEFSVAFKVLCDNAGIKCDYATGYYLDINDTSVVTDYWKRWNQVKLDDKWYNIDVAMDKSSMTYYYFCLSDKDMYKYRSEEFKQHICDNDSLVVQAFQAGMPWDKILYRLVKSDEDMYNLIKTAKEKGYEKIGYLYIDVEFIPKSIYYYFALNSIMPEIGEYGWARISDYVKYTENVLSLPYENGKLKSCNTLSSVEELKQYIFMCAEKGINLSDVWVNIEGFVWSEFVDDISSELYHRYSAIAENIAWEGDVYENKYRHLNIRLTTVDENYDFYEIFLSMEESQNYIEQCVAEGKEKICVIFKLKNVANENITNGSDLESAVFKILDELPLEGYLQNVGLFFDGRVTVTLKKQ